MNNPAKKGRELLRAARSQAVLAKPEEKNVAEHLVIVENHVESLLDGKQESKILKGNMIEDRKVVEDYNKKNEVSNENPSSPHKVAVKNEAQVDNKFKDRMKMFEPKNNKPLIPTKANGIPSGTNNAAANKIGLLNRMNKDKDKEPTKLISVTKKEQVQVNAITTEVYKEQPTPVEKESKNANEQEAEEVPLLPPLEKNDKEKLMKRIATAKGMAKGQTAKNGFDKKQSEKIMQMANMLGNKLSQENENKPKKKFLLNDEDIQRIDDVEEKKEIKEETREDFKLISVDTASEAAFDLIKTVQKNINDIILEKPTNKNVKKKTRQNFNIN